MLFRSPAPGFCRFAQRPHVCAMAAMPDCRVAARWTFATRQHAPTQASTSCDAGARVQPNLMRTSQITNSRTATRNNRGANWLHVWLHVDDCFSGGGCSLIVSQRDVPRFNVPRFNVPRRNALRCDGSRCRSAHLYRRSKRWICHRHQGRGYRIFLAPTDTDTRSQQVGGGSGPAPIKTIARRY